MRRVHCVESIFLGVVKRPCGCAVCGERAQALRRVVHRGGVGGEGPVAFMAGIVEPTTVAGGATPSD